MPCYNIPEGSEPSRGFLKQNRFEELKGWLRNKARKGNFLESYGSICTRQTSSTLDAVHRKTGSAFAKKEKG
jgi:hypothetical protein